METAYSVTAWCTAGAQQVCALNGCARGFLRGSKWVGQSFWARAVAMTHADDEMLSTG